MNGALFTGFKKDFYSRIKDVSIFNCEDFNILKVVLDGLYVKYSLRGKISTHLFGPLPLYQLSLFLRAKKYPGKEKTLALIEQLKKKSHLPYLCADSSAHNVMDEKEIPRSLYFHHIVDTLGRQNTLVFLENVKRKKQYEHDFFKKDFELFFSTLPLSGEEKNLRRSLLAAYNRIKRAGIFSNFEMKNIRIALRLFFDSYRVWSRIFSYLHPRAVYFDQHYHREGLILALKRKGIKAVELQHGLISPEDIFYIFPETIRPVRDRMLFADKILVYGEHWRERLAEGAEYGNDKTDIIGYYLFSSDVVSEENKKDIEQFISGSRVILITTQTDLHKEFIRYAEWLGRDIASRGLPWRIIVKPHPAEKMEHYSPLNALPVIKVVNYNLNYLLSKTELHVSVYSTTLYDALKYGIRNFSLYLEEYSDYVDTMIRSGISERIDYGQNPADRPAVQKRTQRDKWYYFDDFKKHSYKLLQE